MAELSTAAIAAADVEEWVRHVVHARCLRSDAFDPDLFSDPAWDLLLVLFLARLRHERLPASEIGERIGVSRTVAARWIGVLEEKRLVRRKPAAPHSAESIELSPAGQSAMLAWVRGAMESQPAQAGPHPIVDLLMRMRGERR